MKISLNHISKRYQFHWIFKEISGEFNSGEAWAVLGANGSGKSTLLRIIGALQAPSQGSLQYTIHDREISHSDVFRHLSFAAPGMELIEELTLTEFLQFHFKFKPILQGYSISRLIEIANLEKFRHQVIGSFSSGMKQRVKLLQAIFSDTAILILDEPCTNLDQHGFDQYQDWMQMTAGKRLVFVGSNDPQEYSFCRQLIHMADYQQEKSG